MMKERMYTQNTHTHTHTHAAPSRLGAEVVLLFAHAVVEACRLLIGSKGNKTEQSLLLVLFIVRNTMHTHMHTHTPHTLTHLHTHTNTHTHTGDVYTKHSSQRFLHRVSNIRPPHRPYPQRGLSPSLPLSLSRFGDCLPKKSVCWCVCWCGAQVCLVFIGLEILASVAADGFKKPSQY